MAPASPRSHGRIVVAPTAPVAVLAVLAPRSNESSPLKGRSSPRESGATAGMSAGGKPEHHRSGSFPGIRQAWSSEADPVAHQVAQASPHGRRVSSRGSSRRGGKHRPKSCAEYNGDWATATLFSGSRVCTTQAKRSSAVIFRRPSSSRAVPHQRPIFVAGQDGQDARMCVDINAPSRFCSAERTRYDISWRSAGAGRSAANSGGGSNGSRGLNSLRSGTPVRAESVASGAFGTFSVQSSRAASSTPLHWA